MQWSEIITEVKDSDYYNEMEQRVPIFRNPTKAELAGLLRRYGELRGNIIGNDVYVWDSYLATHWEIAQFLGYGLIDCLGIEIGGNDVIYLANAMLHRNRDPNADIEMIRALPSFRGMRVSQRPWRN